MFRQSSWSRQVCLSSAALWFGNLREAEKLAYKLRLYVSAIFVKQTSLSLKWGLMVRQTSWSREISLQTTALWFGNLREAEKLAYNYDFMFRQIFMKQTICLSSAALWFGKLREAEKLAYKLRLYASAIFVKRTNLSIKCGFIKKKTNVLGEKQEQRI